MRKDRTWLLGVGLLSLSLAVVALAQDKSVVWEAINVPDVNHLCLNDDGQYVSCHTIVEWSNKYVLVDEDYYRCGEDLSWSDCEDNDWFGHKMHTGESCCVRNDWRQLGLRSDGVVVWREAEDDD